MKAIPSLAGPGLEKNQHIGELMARAVASVNTALWEGMPNVLLEGRNRGVLGLALKHGPGGVVSEYGLGGFADGSREQLAEVAREQRYARHDRLELAKGWRAYAAAHHSPDAVADQWLEVLEPRNGRAESELPEPVESPCAG